MQEGRGEAQNIFRADPIEAQDFAKRADASLNLKIASSTSTY